MDEGVKDDMGNGSDDMGDDMEDVTAGRISLEEACDKYLASLHSVLWSRSFVVTRPVDREEAVAWLADQIEGVSGFMEAPAMGPPNA